MKKLCRIISFKRIIPFFACKGMKNEKKFIHLPINNYRL